MKLPFPTWGRKSKRNNNKKTKFLSETSYWSQDSEYKVNVHKSIAFPHIKMKLDKNSMDYAVKI